MTDAADLPELLRRAAARDGTAGDPYEEACALARLATAVAAVDGERCRAVLARGRHAARGQASALAELAWAALSAGESAVARELVLSIPDERRRMTALLQLMRVSGDATGLADQAEALLWSLSDPQEAAQSAASLAVLTAPSDPGRTRALIEYAEDLLAYAERLLPSARDPERPAWVLAELAKATPDAPDEARARLDRAATLIQGFPEDRALLLSDLAETAAALGDHARGRAFLTEARTLLATATDPYQRFLTTLELARAAHTIGDPRALTAEAERSIDALSDPAQQVLAWTELARADPARAALHTSRARSLLPSIPDLAARTRVLTALERESASLPAHGLLPLVLEEEPWPVCLTVALLAFPAPGAEVLAPVADLFATENATDGRTPPSRGVAGAGASVSPVRVRRWSR